MKIYFDLSWQTGTFHLKLTVTKWPSNRKKLLAHQPRNKLLGRVLGTEEWCFIFCKIVNILLYFYLFFIFLFCKYFTAISVASSVQVTLQFYFQIFYSTAPNKIVIKLTKLKNTNWSSAKVSWGYKTSTNKIHIQRKKSSK